MTGGSPSAPKKYVHPFQKLLLVKSQSARARYFSAHKFHEETSHFPPSMVMVRVPEGFFRTFFKSMSMGDPLLKRSNE